MQQRVVDAGLARGGPLPGAGTGVGTGARRRSALASAAVLAVVLLAVAAGFAAGFGLGGDGAGAGADPGLARLLRLMAVLKLATVAGAGWLVRWRLGAAAAPPLAAGYLAAIALMGFAPGLIWSLTLIIPAAVAFHAGLLLFLACAYVDRGGARLVLAGRGRM